MLLKSLLNKVVIRSICISVKKPTWFAMVWPFEQAPCDPVKGFSLDINVCQCVVHFYFYNGAVVGKVLFLKLPIPHPLNYCFGTFYFYEVRYHCAV